MVDDQISHDELKIGEVFDELSKGTAFINLVYISAYLRNALNMFVLLSKYNEKIRSCYAIQVVNKNASKNVLVGQ